MKQWRLSRGLPALLATGLALLAPNCTLPDYKIIPDTDGSGGGNSVIGDSGGSGPGGNGSGGDVLAAGGSATGGFGTGGSGVGGLSGGGTGSGGTGSGGTGSGGTGSGGVVDFEAATCLNDPLRRKRTIIPEGGGNHPETDSALGGMTQQEKIDMLNGGDVCPAYDCDFDGTGVPSQEIKDFRMRDGPRGVHTHNGDIATTFAVAMARGASYDVEMEYRVGQVQGEEMLALNYDLSLSPQVNTLRHPRWGRAQESYSEDPLALGKFGAAYVLGMQESVPACAKHFAAHNTEENRLVVSSNLDEQTLRENYTLAFKIIVEEADPGCIMAAYNLVNGQPATANPHLLTDILRDDWEWEGFVVSDRWATEVNDGANVLNSGLDMEMPDRSAFQTLQSDLTNGAVESSRIDEAASRVLNVRAAFGQLDPAPRPVKNLAIVNEADHQALARETAEKGAVLLENNGILPIDTNTVTSIMVMGPDANLPITSTLLAGIGPHGMGDRGSSNTNPPYAVSYAQGLSDRAGLAGITVTTSTTPADAATADLIIVPVTMQHNDEGEAFANGGDRDDMTFGGAHPIHWNPKPTSFINEVAAVNPNVVVLQAVGSAVIDDGWMSNVAAIVQTFYPGQEAGRAVANLLFGDVNFYGRLPFTVATQESDYPAFGNAGTNVTMEYFHGYRKFEAENLTPRYWLGYGLSYTTFEHSELTLLCDSVGADGSVWASVKVTNTGAVAGDEAVLAFIGYPNTTVRRPKKELKAFKRTGLLAPGESAEVLIKIPVRDMRYWGDYGWTLENVTHSLIVAPSANPADPNMQSADFTVN